MQTITLIFKNIESDFHEMMTKYSSEAKFRILNNKGKVKLINRIPSFDKNLQLIKQSINQTDNIVYSDIGSHLVLSNMDVTKSREKGHIRMLDDYPKKNSNIFLISSPNKNSFIENVDI